MLSIYFMAYFSTENDQNWSESVVSTKSFNIQSMLNRISGNNFNKKIMFSVFYELSMKKYLFSIPIISITRINFLKNKIEKMYEKYEIESECGWWLMIKLTIS